MSARTLSHRAPQPGAATHHITRSRSIPCLPYHCTQLGHRTHTLPHTPRLSRELVCHRRLLALPRCLALLATRCSAALAARVGRARCTKTRSGSRTRAAAAAAMPTWLETVKAKVTGQPPPPPEPLSLPQTLLHKVEEASTLSWRTRAIGFSVCIGLGLLFAFLVSVLCARVCVCVRRVGRARVRAGSWKRSSMMMMALDQASAPRLDPLHTHTQHTHNAQRTARCSSWARRDARRRVYAQRRRRLCARHRLPRHPILRLCVLCDDVHPGRQGVLPLAHLPLVSERRRR